MKTYKTKNGDDVFEHQFYSIAEFLKYLENTPTSSTFQQRESLSSFSSSYDFTGTNSYEEAVKLIKYGYNENFNQFLNYKSKIDKYLQQSKISTKLFNDYIGHVPDVKAYLEGNPLSMLNKCGPKRNKINIYYNCGYACITTIEQVFNFGVLTLALVDALEKLNYNVDLHIFELSHYYKEIFFANYIFKKENERANIKKLYFVLCHPSFLRRLGFRLMEVTEGLSSEWTYAYGKVCGVSYIKDMFNLEENNIIITDPDEMGVKGNNLITDANNFFTQIETQSNIKVLKKEFKK